MRERARQRIEQIRVYGERERKSQRERRGRERRALPFQSLCLSLDLVDLALPFGLARRRHFGFAPRWLRQDVFSQRHRSGGLRFAPFLATFFPSLGRGNAGFGGFLPERRRPNALYHRCWQRKKEMICTTLFPLCVLRGSISRMFCLSDLLPLFPFS